MWHNRTKGNTYKKYIVNLLSFFGLFRGSKSTTGLVAEAVAGKLSTDMNSVQEGCLETDEQLKVWDTPLVDLDELGLAGWQMERGVKWRMPPAGEVRMDSNWFINITQEWFNVEESLEDTGCPSLLDWNSEREKVGVLSMRDLVLDLQPFASDKGAEGWWERQGVMSLNMEELETAKRAVEK